MNKENQKPFDLISRIEQYIKDYPSLTAGDLRRWLNIVREEVRKTKQSWEAEGAAIRMFAEWEKQSDQFVDDVHKGYYVGGFGGYFSRGEFLKFKDKNEYLFTSEKSPLRDISNPQLDDVHNNWKSFSAYVAEQKDGSKLIGELQLACFDRIMWNAEAEDQITHFYDLKKLKIGLSKYRDMLSEGFIGQLNYAIKTIEDFEFENGPIIKTMKPSMSIKEQNKENLDSRIKLFMFVVVVLIIYGIILAIKSGK